MPLRNTIKTYGSVAKFFHWIIALLIIVMLLVGFFMDDIENDQTKSLIYNYHKLIGLTVLSLVILRVLWRWTNPVPGLPLVTPPWEILLERTVKFLFYLSMFLMPLSGWIFSTAAGHAPHLGDLTLSAPFIPENKALSHFFKEAHEFIAWSLIGLLCLHMAGVLKHHLINKDNILTRMLPGGK